MSQSLALRKKTKITSFQYKRRIAGDHCRCACLLFVAGDLGESLNLEVLGSLEEGGQAVLHTGHTIEKLE